MKVAIVHDWLVGGGAERVVEELHQMYPQAPIYTAYCSPEWRKRLQPTLVVTSYMQRWPFSKLRKFLPVLRQHWFSHLDLSDYDLVISSSGNGEAKGVKVADGTVHICYCHSPTHFYWRHYKEYMANPGFGPLNPLVRWALKRLVGRLRRWDLKAAQGPDFFVANSRHIQHDIRQYYERESVVIPPPVDVEKFAKLKPKGARSGFVTVGRQVPYKRTDLIIAACTQLGLPLTVIGNGPEHNKLRKLGGPTVIFINNAGDEAVANHLVNAEAFLFAAFEDFGITPVEALAAGTPVIAYRGGGALDYVKDGKTGLLFEHQTVASLKEALQSFSRHKFDSAAIAKSTQTYSAAHFKQRMTKLVELATKRLA